MALVMSERDVVPYHCDFTRGELFVFARPGTIGLEWPRTLRYQDQNFKYHCNEVMPAEMAGDIGGHAKYVINN